MKIITVNTIKFPDLFSFRSSRTVNNEIIFRCSYDTCDDDIRINPALSLTILERVTQLLPHYVKIL